MAENRTGRSVCARVNSRSGTSPSCVRALAQGVVLAVPTEPAAAAQLLAAARGD